MSTSHERGEVAGAAGEPPTPPQPPAPRRPSGRPPLHSEPRPHQKPLRVTDRDDELMALVRPYLISVTNESELSYQLVREGLLMRLAILAALGGDLGDAIAEDVVAAHAAQQLLLCLPLLRRTGKLALLGMEVPQPQIAPAATVAPDATLTASTVPQTRALLDPDDLDEQSGRDAEGLSGGLI